MRTLWLRWTMVVALYAGARAMAAQVRMLQLADSIVKYQMRSGGWSKNQNWLEGVEPEQAKMWQRTGVGSTIDNGATVGEMKVLANALAKVEQMKKDGSDRSYVKALEAQAKRYRTAFVRGLDFLLEMQYDNGGFPQFYPPKRVEDYSTEITFNDNAMVNVLRLLRDVAEGIETYQSVEVDKKARKRCRRAYGRGLQCVLDCQIRVDEQGHVLTFGTEAWHKGRRTVWCQQHDRKMLVPTNARAYELPSYTGHGETVELVELLMEVPKPSAEVQAAVKGAVEWLEAHAMRDVVLEPFVDEDGRRDVRLVKRKGAPLLWARYYDLDWAEPFFCDRDGVPVRNLSEIGYERRNGYQWVGYSPQRVIDKYRYNLK